jgi:hypothetical protein
MSVPLWLLDDAAQFCTEIEALVPKLGYHVALTGGCLYKSGPRLDCDLVFYQIRSGVIIARPSEVMYALERDGLLDPGWTGGGWRFVGKYGERKVDLLFPEQH